jgi:hypothetical protein
LCAWRGKITANGGKIISRSEGAKETREKRTEKENRDRDRAGLSGRWSLFQLKDEPEGSEG